MRAHHAAGGPDEDPSAVRRRRMRDLAQVHAGRGLEIGPLYSPVVGKDEVDVSYVDVHLTPELKAHYATHPGMPLDQFVDVDFALVDDGRTRSLAEAVGAAAPFDWVIASHVVEHVPDVVGWLQQVADVLVDGGRLVLAVPDRRFTFDVLRPETTVGQMLRAHEDADERPSTRAVFDHFSTTVTTTAADLWRGHLPTTAATIHGVDYAWDQVLSARRDRTYVDCHVWLFTPTSLVSQLRVLARLGLLALTLEEMVPTARDELEFYVVLRRVPRDLDADAARRAAVAGYPDDQGAPALDADADEQGYGSSDGTGHTMGVSDLERRVLLAKRRVLERARSSRLWPRR